MIMEINVLQAALLGFFACLASMPGMGGSAIGNYTLGRPLVGGLICGLILAMMYRVGEQYSGYYDCDIEKVNMIRLKQLTLGYNLHERIVKKLGLTSARLFLTGENLLLLTNYSGLDPEIVDITSGIDQLQSYPLPRKFTVGLTINF